MGRAPCCDKASVKKGPWSPEEDLKLREYIEKDGTGGNWIALPQKAGLRRCGKSCRLRWLNYLRPNIKHGEFSDDEDRIICTLFANIGSRWSIIAAQLPGRTDNDIKNYWNTKLKKKLMSMVVQLPPSSQRKPHQAATFSSLHHNFSSSTISSALSTSSSSAYKCNNNNNNSNSNYYYSQAMSFTNLDQTTAISIPSVFQSHPQESVLGPMQNYYQVKDTLLTFGGDQSSCTSSDGSSCNGGSNGEQMGLQSYFYINGVEENQKFMLSNNGTTDGVDGWSEEKPKGLLWGDSDQTPIMDYGFEEIKQLISTNICNFFVDENKTEERVMYY